MKLKSLRTGAAFILATLMLVVAAATTVATAQTYTDVYNFTRAEDGSLSAMWPDILAQGRDGNLYGTTPGGAFRFMLSGTLKLLRGGTSSGLTLGTDGSFYGTTQEGGDMACGSGYGCGTIFKITPSGSLTTLYSFTGGADGAYPIAPPIEGKDGSFYGTTEGGEYGANGYGTIFKITKSGNLATLYSFTGGGDGGGPQAPPVPGTDGNLYGTTYYGGSSNAGVVFKMTPRGVVTTLYAFDGTHGATPRSPVVQGSDGNFYGTTEAGGTYGGGVVYKLTPQGAITALHNFPDPNYPNDGYEVFAGLVQATDGNFYGVTQFGGTGACKYNKGCGVIFQITPTGDYSILYDFESASGSWPESTPIQHTNGKIYGLACCGGTHNHGVFYSFDMGLGPFISLVTTTGKVGKTIEILGQGFTGTTAVAFSGTPATFTVVHDTYLTAIVPTGATTGFVTVTTPSGTLTSNKQFTVKP